MDLSPDDEGESVQPRPSHRLGTSELHSRSQSQSPTRQDVPSRVRSPLPLLQSDQTAASGSHSPANLPAPQGAGQFRVRFATEVVERGHRHPPPRFPAHVAERARAAAMRNLSSSQRSAYTAFMLHLESGSAALPDGRVINTMDDFNGLGLADQNALVNAAIDAGLDSNARQAINQAQNRSDGQRLQPRGGPATSRTGPRPRNPRPQLRVHLEALNNLPSQGLNSYDRGYYSHFLAHLESGHAMLPSGRVISTLNEFNALALTDQNALLIAATGEGGPLNKSTHHSINRVQQRPDDLKLQGQRRYTVSGPRVQRPAPTLPEHVTERNRVASMQGLTGNERSAYTAFMVRLENGNAGLPDGRAISSLTQFNALPMGDQNALVNAAIAAGLEVGARRAINRAQGRSGGHKLSDDSRRRPGTSVWQLPVSSGTSASALASTSTASSSTAPASVTVKREPILQRLSFEPQWDAQPLDQARTAYHRVLQEHWDLTGVKDKVRLQTVASPDLIENHPMVPNPAHDAKFVIRDPRNPNRVPPRYAGPNGECHPDVKVASVKFGWGFKNYLNKLLQDDARMNGMPSPSSREQVLSSLLQDVQATMQRQIQGRAEAHPRCTARQLGPHDVQPHESALIGRYGVVADEPPEGTPLPTLGQGRILGLYMGGAIEDDDSATLDAVADAHPDYLSYAAVASRRGGGSTTYSGLGVTNTISFINTALKPGTGKPKYDHDRINAIFVPFDLKMLDKDGVERKEAVLAAIALDNLFSPSNPQRTVLLDYGDDYLPHFEAHAGPDKQAGVVIKQEPASP